MVFFLFFSFPLIIKVLVSEVVLRYILWGYGL